jgi:hypothetical protein
MHLAATPSPRWLGLVLVAGLVGLRCGGGRPPLPRAVTIESLDGNKGFGAAFAAHGSTLLMVDRVCRSPGRRCSSIVRFGELAAGRVVEPLQFFAGLYLTSLDVTGSAAVIRTGGALDDTLHFFVRDRAGRWTAGQELAVEESCQARYYPNVHLGDEVLVVESDTAWCIYERGAAGWRYGAQLRHDGGRAIGLSRGRIVEVSGDDVRIYARRPEGWQPTRGFAPPAGITLDWTRVAVTDRWLVTLGSPRPEDSATYEVYVMDLETGALAARLPSQLADDHFAERIAARETASNTTIVALGSHAQRWELTGRHWRPRGEISGGRDPSSPIGELAIAELIWLGDPAPSPSPRGGRVHGFRRD